MMIAHFNLDDGLSEYKHNGRKRLAPHSVRKLADGVKHDVQERHAVGKVQRQDWSD